MNQSSIGRESNYDQVICQYIVNVISHLRTDAKSVAVFFILFCVAILTFILCISCSVDVNPPMYIDETDPDNPYYVVPYATILTDFSSGDTLTVAEVLIQWTGSVVDSCLFIWSVDSLIFSDWTEDTLVLLPPLDEGWHTFWIRAKYLNGIEQELSASITFFINAVSGPALRLTPAYQIVEPNTLATVEIWLEEVFNWSGGRITVVWDHMQAAVDRYLLLDQSADFLSQNNSTIVSRVEDHPDSLVFDIGLVDDLVYGITGSGRIASIDFINIVELDSLNIKFGNSCDFRDPQNISIPIASMPGAVIRYR